MLNVLLRVRQVYKSIVASMGIGNNGLPLDYFSSYSGTCDLLVDRRFQAGLYFNLNSNRSLLFLCGDVVGGAFFKLNNVRIP